MFYCRNPVRLYSAYNLEALLHPPIVSLGSKIFCFNKKYGGGAAAIGTNRDVSPLSVPMSLLHPLLDIRKKFFHMRVALVIGTRPQIIKSAPIVREAVGRGVGLDVVHTGQHYDYELSRVFFNELELPDPVVNLGVGSCGHGEQTGRMLMGLEKTTAID